MRFAAGFFIGLVWSNFVEYVCHRWAMHWPSLYQPAAMRHVLHHAAPSNPQHITMKLGFWISIFFVNIVFFAVPDQLLHLRMLTGAAVAFWVYIVVGIEVHLRIHEGRWVPEAWRIHHLLHHSRPQTNFNIFLPAFDWLLGSRAVPLSRCIREGPPDQLVYAGISEQKVIHADTKGNLPQPEEQKIEGKD